MRVLGLSWINKLPTISKSAYFSNPFPSTGALIFGDYASRLRLEVGVPKVSFTSFRELQSLYANICSSV